jgi:prepilin-type N-terminal cleavage/methylation domain-containing protein
MSRGDRMSKERIMNNKYKIGRKSSKGLTLIELLISFALIGIVLSAAFSLQLFGVRSFKRGEEKSDNQFDVRMAAEFITKQLRYAKTVEILTSVGTPTSGYNYIYIKDGKIKHYRNGAFLNPPGIGEVPDFTLSFSRVSESMLGFKVGKQGGAEYDLDSKVSVMNIPISSSAKISGTSGVGIRYTLGDLSDAQAVEMDKSWLEILNPNAITASIYLPTEGPNKTTISWTTSNSGVVTSGGTVTRKSVDTSVTLTATISRGTVTTTKIFPVIVKMLDSTLTIVKINNINEAVNQNEVFVMPLTVEAQMSDGSVQNRNITWNPTSINTSTSGTKTSSGTVAGYSQPVILTLVVKGASAPVGQIQGTNTNTQFKIVYDKNISSVSITSNTTGRTATTSISGTAVTISFNGIVGNNKNISVKVTSTDGGYASYTYMYKNNGAWR